MEMTRRLLPCGPTAWLVELDAEDVLGFAEAIDQAANPGVAEVVPAACTVLVEVVDRTQLADAGEWLTTLAPATSGQVEAPAVAVELEVVYDGDDLAAVAETCGMTTAQVIERHTAPDYQCAFCGFAPGFAYLTGLDPALQIPRRATPRIRVPAGSVAIAATYSAVYPTSSPGGWHLLGHADAVLFDPVRTPPALLPPGTTVRFRDAGR